MTSSDGGEPQRVLRRLDAAQRRNPVLSFPIAVIKKFGDDRAGQLAALIAYYGFFSLFPLLLVFATVVGFLLGDNPDLRQRLLDSALRQFPVVGTRIAVRELTGSPVALVVGVVGALWSGTAVVNAAQQAMDDIWGVPRLERPNLIVRALRALLLFVVFGAAIVVSAFLAGAGTGTGIAAIGLKAASMLAVLLISVALFASAYRVLTVARVTWRDVLPGAVVAALAWSVLLLAGSWLVDTQIRHAKQIYGLFAIVIGLLFWIYLAAQVLLFAAEVNVVRARRLWPRSLIHPPLAAPDREVLSGRAKDERAIPQETVDVRLEERTSGPPGGDR